MKWLARRILAVSLGLPIHSGHSDQQCQMTINLPGAAGVQLAGFLLGVHSVTFLADL